MYGRLYSRTGTGTDDRNRTRPGTSDQMTGPDDRNRTRASDIWTGCSSRYSYSNRYSNRKQDRNQTRQPDNRPVTRPGTRTVSCEQDQTRWPDQTIRPSGQTTGYRPDRAQIQQTPTAICIAKAENLYRNSRQLQLQRQQQDQKPVNQDRETENRGGTG